MTQKILNSIKTRLSTYGRWIRHISNVLLGSLAVMVVSQLLVSGGMFPKAFRVIGYAASVVLSLAATAFLIVLVLVLLEFLFGTLEFGIFGWIGGKKDNKQQKSK